MNLRDALGGSDRASLEMHLEAAIERNWRCTWSWSIWMRSIWMRSIGRKARRELKLYSLVNSQSWECDESCLYLCAPEALEVVDL